METSAHEVSMTFPPRKTPFTVATLHPLYGPQVVCALELLEGHAKTAQRKRSKLTTPYEGHLPLLSVLKELSQGLRFSSLDQAMHLLESAFRYREFIRAQQLCQQWAVELKLLPEAIDAGVVVVTD